MQAYECLTVANVYEYLLCCHAMCCESGSYNLHQVICVFPNCMPNSTVVRAHFSQPARKRYTISTLLCFFSLDVVFWVELHFRDAQTVRRQSKLKTGGNVVYEILG
jgi:hypothetical protein